MRIEMARSEVWFASHANRKSVNQRYSHSPKMHQASQRRTRRLRNEGQAPAKAREMENGNGCTGKNSENSENSNGMSKMDVVGQERQPNPLKTIEPLVLRSSQTVSEGETPRTGADGSSPGLAQRRAVSTGAAKSVLAPLCVLGTVRSCHE